MLYRTTWYSPSSLRTNQRSRDVDDPMPPLTGILLTPYLALAAASGFAPSARGLRRLRRASSAVCSLRSAPRCRERRVRARGGCTSGIFRRCSLGAAQAFLQSFIKKQNRYQVLFFDLIRQTCLNLNKKVDLRLTAKTGLLASLSLSLGPPPIARRLRAPSRGKASPRFATAPNRIRVCHTLLVYN